MAAASRHTNQRRTVAHRPRHVHRRFIPRHEPLVGVHERIRDCAHTACVAKQPAYIMKRHLRELPLRAGRPERVLLALEQGLVRVHAAAVLPEDRLRHERREQPELGRDLLHDESERRDVVRRLEGVGVSKVDLVLPVRHFVVRRLDLKAHSLQHVDHRASRVFAEVSGCEVEISSHVVRGRQRLARRPRTEQEKLRLHARVHRVAHTLCLREQRLQRAARVAGKRRPIGRVDVADQPADTIGFVSAGSPGKYPERVEIGSEQHVRLLDAHESLDR